MNPAEAEPAIPPTERLVNLTPHELVLQAFERPGDGRDAGQAAESTTRLPAQGSFARVDDRAGQLSRTALHSAAGEITLTRLRRSARLIDLPPATAGTRLVVSRVTALAARHRRDLVFPHDELRDPSGRVIGARGLAAFRPAWSPFQQLRDWRAAARASLGRKPLGPEWPTGVLFVTATALLGGFVALFPPAADNAAHNGWAGGGLAVTSWSSIACLVAGSTLLIAGALRWRRRGQILGQRGTAYIIDEIATPWQHEEKQSALADIKAGFARTLLVPGPDALGDAWQWQADAQSAPRWDDKVDQLVRSFWTVHYNDDQVTKNALFTWAPWPVAMAFGARATAHRRGLVLNVRQRPSYGAAGPRHELSLTDPPHDFLRAAPPKPLSDASPEHTVTLLESHITLTITPLSRMKENQAPDSPAPRPATRHGHPDQRGPAPVLLLLVRTTHDVIGPIPLDLASVTEPVKVHACDRLTSSVLPTGPHRAAVAEWRLDSATDPIPQLAWGAFPAAAEQIADWVIAQTAAHEHPVVLLATRMPQELAVGLGVQFGQRNLWPQQAYPVYFERQGLVVPDLRLGRESISARRS